MSSFRKRSPAPHNRLPASSPSISSATALRAGGGLTNPSAAAAASSLLAPIFDNAPFIASTWTFTVVNALGFVVSLVTGSHVHLDLIGTGAFAFAGIQFLLDDAPKVPVVGRSLLSATCMTIWGTKLAGFLFFRALQTGHDKRLDDTLSTISGTFGFWFVSWLWGIICSLPHTLGTTSSLTGNGLTTKIGAIMYLVGLVLESTADVQKWIFKQSNPNNFCNVGVWSISQHPNFLGNLLLWGGIFIMNAPALIEPIGASVGGGGNISIWKRLWSWRRLSLALLSPLFMWTLFSGQANGTITNAVELANQRYGDDPAYQKYIAETPKIMPNIFKMMLKE